ncbi:drug/metabolite transporter (DMT)-like permease [Bacillus ectoiniformans]|uniref:DMT family transporter n=1 Tax=Bacillus ectoiniformans TaxID=1494429 RepID=UPI001955FBDB|nr:DMT family transporter [Bacillus ectoiniformans]MBM7647928.1 drug/metabolite transporter (DMT)-like permease [Bacillus ectoiniformans]
MKWLADVSLLFVAFIWGVTFVIVQNAIAVLPPLLFNGLRFSLAAVILLVILAFRKEVRLLTKETWRNGAILGVCLTIGYAFQTIGLLYTTVSKTGFITGLSVVLVPILAFILLKKQPSASAMLGSLMAATGLYLLTNGSAGSFNIGDFFVLICAFGFALHIIFTDTYAKSSSALALTFVQILSVAIFCLLGGFVMEDWQTALTAANLGQFSVWSALFITAILATALAFFIQTYAQKFTSPTRVVLILAMEPVFGAITAYLWIDERLYAAGFAGCLFIFFGMLLAELPIQRMFFSKSALHK